MWKDKSSIQTKFLNQMTYIVFISIGLWCLIWIQGEYSTFKSESVSLRSADIQYQESHLKNEVELVIQNINIVRLQAEKKLEVFLKERVDEAFSTAMYIYQQNIDSKSLPEIEKMIKDALISVRFNDGRGYYFAVSLDGVKQLYPINPEFEGKNLIALQDSKESFFIQNAIEVIRRKGEGFVKYSWTKPDQDSSILYDKISFIKYFKPLKCYLGTGEYLDEAKKSVQNDVLNWLSNLRFGTEGYFFGSTYQGGTLFSSGKIGMSSSNIWELTDPNGVKIIQEQIKIAKKPDGGFVHYSWNKLNVKDLSPKVSFVRGIPEWEWVVGAGVYLDTIEATISENRAALIVGLKKRIARSLVILAALLCLIYFWSKRISYQIQKSVDTFLSFLERARTNSIFINPEDIQLKEFKDIAVSTNKMLEEKRKANETLKNSENKYRNLLNTIPYGVQLTDLEGKITYSNPAHHQIHGYADDSLFGKYIWDLIAAEGKKIATKEYYQSIFKEQPHPIVYFNVNKTKDGRLIDTQINWDYIRDIKGEIEGIISIISDITEQEQAAEALQKAHDELEQRIEERTLELQKTHRQLLHAEKLAAIGKLSASIAHEFNNPLQGVMNTLKGVARRSKLDDDDAGLMTLALGECHRMRDLIKSLQDFNRPTSSQKALIDIHASLDSLLILWKKELTTRKIGVKKIFSVKMPQIIAVGDQIKQVFLNLLKNAADACINEGIITIETEVLEKDIVVRFHDTGIGIKPEDRKHIFEPFFSTKAEIKGTGLGLSISYGIIKEHGGELTLDNDSSQGTIFKVTLPIEGQHNDKR